MKRALFLIVFILAAAALAAAGWVRYTRAPGGLSAGNQAVLLTNGQVYYGKLQGLGSAYPVLTDVYYIQVGVEPESKESKSVLLKRGKEWHAPDRMVLNASHILLIEPVTNSSKLAELISRDKRGE